MTAPDWLWAVFTLVAATAQTFRNATQKSLTDRLGIFGATHIRFLFGLPFGLLALSRRLYRCWRTCPHRTGVPSFGRPSAPSARSPRRR